MKQAHLWRRLLYEGLYMPSDIIPPQRPNYLREVVDRIITLPIIVDSVQQSIGNYDCDFWRYTQLSIPFNNFWVEGSFQIPGFMWGCKVTSIKISDAMVQKWTQEDLCCEDTLLQLMVIQASPGLSPFSFGKILTFVKADGRLVGSDKGEAHYIPLISKTLQPMNENHEAVDIGMDPGRAASMQYVQQVCDVLLMLGCSNVGLKSKPMGQGCERAERRHGARAGGYRYHVLVVRKPGAKSDSPSVEVGVMPRHVCRGHFSEYGPRFGKGLLFGRLEGRFYVPPHMRGKAEHGVVEKDYQIAGAGATTPDRHTATKTASNGDLEAENGDAD